MGKVICIANQKGGVGKTNTCVNLGIALAMAGKRVCLIDSDPQGSLTESLGYRNPDEMENTLADVLKAEMEPDDKLSGSDYDEEPVCDKLSRTIKKTILHHEEGVDLIPGNIELAGIEVLMVNLMSRELLLKTAIRKIRDEYDYIIIDCMSSSECCGRQRKLGRFGKKGMHLSVFCRFYQKFLYIKYRGPWR